MENNHFEKQVRERLADLKIHPSPENWSVIEGKIRKKKDNKPFAWIFLAGLLLLSGLGYLLMHQKKEPVRLVTQVPPAKKQPQSTTGKEIISFPLQKDSKANTPKENLPVAEGADKNSPPTGLLATAANVPPDLTPQQGIKNPNELAAPAALKNKKSEQTVNNMESAKASLRPVPETSGQPNHPGVQPDSSAEVVKFTPGSIGLEKIEKEGEGNYSGDMAKEPPGSIMNGKQDSSDILKVKHRIAKPSGDKTAKSKRKWEWGFSLTAGKAIPGKGISLALLESNTYQDLSSTVGNAYPSYSISRPPGIIISKPKSSVGFNAGLLLKKSISPNVSLMGGLNYSYYSNTVSIYTQNSFNNSALSAGSEQYHNSFHFIEMPIMIDFQLNRNKKVPLHISAGPGISRLLMSEAVELKDGYYVRDGSFFNKTDVGIGAAFSATFFKKVSIGPFARYGLGKIANQGVYANKHWNYIGLKLDYLFVK